MRPFAARMVTAAAFLGAGCHTMKPVALGDLEAVHPARVWVTRTDHSRVLVEGPRVLGNRLGGFVEGKYEVMQAADVEGMRMRTAATGRTLALVAAGAVGMTAAMVAVSSSGKFRDPCASSSTVGTEANVTGSDCDPSNIPSP